ncbi:hypothetical protein [Pedobacter gandavensis]|uniref:hypothetical protein n=1 Tax=Pedobacter gandavensis TaxID=2679963 RepID=UPI00292DBBDD|nr:hypothetical protein [Pedobacter gandavensis]
MKAKINSLEELIAALDQDTPLNLEIQTSILCPYGIVLPVGFSLSGLDRERSILSFSNSDGIALTANNEISNLNIQTKPGNRAIYLLSNQADLGTFSLSNLSITGQVQILTRSGTLQTKLIAENIDIVGCDARCYSEQPQKYGVNVYQGAFTVYNYNSQPDSVIQATLTNISIGRKGAPVIGSGLFIGGFGDNGGWVLAEQVSTADIYSNGMIPYGQPNLITAAVFIGNGAKIKKLHNKGVATTYGVNDMVLDTWGQVDRWLAEKPITSYGPSGIGFVNFGIVDSFEAKDKIETFGLGARGFNQYDGTINQAVFHSIETHGNGSIGIQVSKPIGSISIKNDLITHGAVGQSLVKGVLLSLPADGLSVKPNGEIKQLNIAGSIITYGSGVHSLNIEGGKVNELAIKGEVIAEGKNAVAVSVTQQGKTSLNQVRAISRQGIAVLIEKGVVTDRTDLQARGDKGDIVEE